MRRVHGGLGLRRNADGWIYLGQSHACAGGLSDANIYHDIGGEPGVGYLATLHFYGIVAPKNYGNGVTRDAGSGRPDLNGGTPTPWGAAAGNHEYPGSNYETFELRVEDENQQEVAVYYLNTDTQEGHYTMLLDFEKIVPIIGGGRVHFRHFDTNCRIIKNCGTSVGVDINLRLPATTALHQQQRVPAVGLGTPQPPKYWFGVRD